MHIFEINKIENASILYNFQIKKRELFLFANTFRTDKWLSLENWSYIYSKLSVLSKKYIDSNTHETSVVHVPGNLKLSIKFQLINSDIKKLLGLESYKFEYYLNIIIDYVSETNVDLIPCKVKREKSREYSPSLISTETDNHYTPLPTNNKPNVSESSTYKPAPPFSGKKPKDEYIPESGKKEVDSPDISYKPTRIEELSQTSSDGGGTPTESSSKRRRKYESLNEDYLRAQNRKRVEESSTVKSVEDSSLTEHNKRKQKGKNKKKSKITELFAQTDSDSKDEIEDTPPDLLKKENIKKSSDSKSKISSSLKRKKRSHGINSKFSSFAGLMDIPLIKNKFNCHKLPVNEIKDSFKVVKPKLDKCIDDYYNAKRRVKLYCEDPLIVHELFTETQASFMYEQLQEAYLSKNDTGANFADLFSQVLLPAWALFLSARLHKIPEDTISKLKV